MLDKKTELIIVKYFSNSASTEDMLELSEWIKDSSNGLIFRDYVKTNYLIDINMLDFNTEKEKEKIFKKIEKTEKTFRINRLNKLYKYAAILIVTFGLLFVYENKEAFFLQNKDNSIGKIKIEPGKDKAILTLESGDEVALEKDKKIELDGRYVEDEKLIYITKAESKNKKIQYNYLTIPRGGQFFVQLSDGTKVWLNSDTKLKFPVAFNKGETRKVELVYGEAYFDVSPSTNHNGDTFKVQTRIQEIDVLGTEFNIKAYQDETDIVTTLVEGKVTVGNGILHKYLTPSEQSTMNIKDLTIHVKKVPRVFDEISWKDGYFSFKQKPMKDIMKVLSRWYDIAYVFKDIEKENKSFTGVLDRENTINEILAYIQKTNEINFQITSDLVTIE
tara:strand:+ start:52377 stop:53543 length:1167 start_codon:yes stop_codon:yes gene_type:complete